MTGRSLLFFIFFLFFNSTQTLELSAQGKKGQKTESAGHSGYVQFWTKVDSLEQKGLHRSALELSKEIFNTAKADKNTSMLVKAMMHRLKFQAFVEEDALLRNMHDLNEEIELAKFPERQLLHSMLAEIYWMYYQQNRYRFFDRSETVGIQESNPATWDMRKIVNESMKHFSRSLEQSEESKAMAIGNIDEILLNEDSLSSRELRPTLYDFLAHRVLDFYANSESGLTAPAEKFRIKDESFIADLDVFLKMDISSVDTTDFKYRACLLFKDILAFHKADADPGALIDADLKRLDFIRGAINISQKDSLYEKSLYSLFNKFRNHRLSAEVLFKIASLHEQKGNTYNPEESEANKWELVNAIKYCDTILTSYPGSRGAMMAMNLKQQIMRPSLVFFTEQVNAMGKEFLSLVQYKNIQKLYFRLINDRNDIFSGGRGHNDLVIRELFKLPAIKEWSVELPQDPDMQVHSVETAIPGLDFGKYILLVADHDKYVQDEGNFAFNSFRVSDLSLLSNTKAKGEYELYVLDRVSGKPIKGVSAEVTTNTFNRATSKYDTSIVGNYQSDKDGRFIIFPAKEQGRNFSVKIKYATDINFLQESFYQYNPGQRNSLVTERTVFFTDRSIYRPGQLIYFKALLLTVENGQPKIHSNQQTTIQFLDVNGQLISEQKLKSNEFGTVEGVFTAPENVLTGRMSIQNTSGSTGINVEEYKRPRFEVVFEPVEGEYKLGESINVKGYAETYAGVPVDAALVKYYVRREAIYPPWCYWYRSIPQSANEQEILSSEMITDSDGKFSFSFIAQADESIEEIYQPTFNFTISADVTDINSETRSGNTMLRVGYTSMELSTDMPKVIYTDSKATSKIIATNLSGKTVPAKVILNVYKIAEPERLLKTRLWNRADKHLYSKEEYIRKFPFDVFDKEDDFLEWKREKNVWTTEINTGIDSIIRLDPQKLEQGFYLMEGSAKDSYGKEMKLIHYFDVLDHSSNTVSGNQFYYTQIIKDNADPGMLNKLVLGTASSNAYFLLETLVRNEVVKSEWIRLNKEQKVIEIPVKEDYRGNFSMRINMVKESRVYQDQILFKVPWKTKDLRIEYQSFRSTLEPGKKEEWKLKIKDHTGKIVDAELLASMYDASLDVFLDHKWKTSFFPGYGHYSRMNTHGFDLTYSTSYSNVNSDIKYISPRVYDRLNWFGYNFDFGYSYLNAGSTRGVTVESLSMASPPAEMDGLSLKNSVDMNAKMESVDMIGSKDELLKTLPPPAVIRKNLQETAFFLPRIYTGKDSTHTISFSTPEALTRWKLQLFGHSKEMEYVFDEKEVLTQKELMLTPNLPRFLRAGDTLWLSAKINSLVSTELQISVTLSLSDAISLKSMDSTFSNFESKKVVSVSKEKSANVSWRVIVPENVSAVVIRMIASSGTYSDGEEHLLPVLTNRQLVTESLPIWTRGKETRNYKLTKLVENKSTSLKHHRLKLEYTSNPVWSVVQAIPYLMEYPYQCSEQVFSRYYANSLATHIANSSPRIKEIFSQWKSLSPESFLSNLEKDQDLKSIVLAETPWVLEAKSEKEQKERLGLLFDLNRMSNEQSAALSKLEKQQIANGAWPWFEGMPDNRYITQHIVIGLLQLKHLNVLEQTDMSKIDRMIEKSLKYLDNQIANDYAELIRMKAVLKDHVPSTLQIQYLYMRSFDFVNSKPIPSEKEFNYFMERAEKSWLKYNLYMQSMLAITLNRNGKQSVAIDIINSLKDNALRSDEMGMYWKNNNGGYYWTDAAIETQAMLIEAFMEVVDDRRSVEEMKIWLLRKKQVNNWKTTKGTVAACYALMLRASNWIGENNVTRISIGNKIIHTDESAPDREAGSGHFSVTWSGNEIEKEMGSISLSPISTSYGSDSTIQSPQISWGALYWQYFEDLDKITNAETNGLRLTKNSFVQRNSPTGPLIEKIIPGTTVKVGDKLIIRITLKTDRDMEYLHLKDLRAAGLEPLNVISGYKWQDGFGYYESTGDVATNFFISYLPRGEYVFEYSLRAFNEGDFSGGITTIQNMYAPEFSSHSFGERLQILRE